MIIGIDARLWSETGVGRYIRNLLTGIDIRESEEASGNSYKVFFRKKDIAKVNFKSRNIVKCMADVPWHGISEQIILPKLFRNEKIDLMHFPYFSVPVFYNNPYIVTIHDLIISNYPTGKASTLPYPIYRLKRLGYQYVLSNSIKKAKQIIVPSFAVKKDLIQLFPKTSPSKIQVIYEGGFDSFSKIKKDNLLSGKKYFLRVGNMYPHKNLEVLIKGFSMFLKKDKYKDYFLVLVGKRDFFFKEVEQKIKSYGVSKNVLFIEEPEDEVLYSLYRHAICSVVPSLMEGFSLTALESISSKCPVIISDIPVHREICGDVAIYFNPKKAEDLKDKMEFVSKLKEEDREKLIEKGMTQSKKFSWNKMLNETLKVYKDVLKSIKPDDYFVHL